MHGSPSSFWAWFSSPASRGLPGGSRRCEGCISWAPPRQPSSARSPSRSCCPRPGFLATAHHLPGRSLDLPATVRWIITYTYASRSPSQEPSGRGFYSLRATDELSERCSTPTDADQEVAGWGAAAPVGVSWTFGRPGSTSVLAGSNCTNEFETWTT